MASDPRRVIARFAGTEAGPLLIAIGGLHGNEPSGVHALRRVARSLEAMRPFVVGVAYGWLIGAVALGALPWTALIALAALAPALAATKQLLAHAPKPAELAPAIRTTIGAAMLHGILLAVGLAAAHII